MKNIILLLLLINVLGAYSQITVNDRGGNNTTNVQIKLTDKCIGNKPLFINNRLINPSNYSFFNLNITKCNLMAFYNLVTMSYDFYPSTFRLNFDIYSSQVANQHFSPVKIDSVNPYGVTKPLAGIIAGGFGYLLMKIQE